MKKYKIKLQKSFIILYNAMLVLLIIATAYWIALIIYFPQVRLYTVFFLCLTIAIILFLMTLFGGIILFKKHLLIICALPYVISYDSIQSIERINSSSTTPELKKYFMFKSENTFIIHYTSYDENLSRYISVENPDECIYNIGKTVSLHKTKKGGESAEDNMDHNPDDF